MEAKRQGATGIVKQLREAGFQAYWVGGCVRDLVMGREPKDFDIATDATPTQVTLKIVSTLGKETQQATVQMSLRPRP